MTWRAHLVAAEALARVGGCAAGASGTVSPILATALGAHFLPLGPGARLEGTPDGPAILRRRPDPAQWLADTAHLPLLVDLTGVGRGDPFLTLVDRVRGRPPEMLLPREPGRMPNGYAPVDPLCPGLLLRVDWRGSATGRELDEPAHDLARDRERVLDCLAGIPEAWGPVHEISHLADGGVALHIDPLACMRKTDPGQAWHQALAGPPALTGQGLELEIPTLRMSRLRIEIRLQGRAPWPAPKVETPGEAGIAVTLEQTPDGVTVVLEGSSGAVARPQLGIGLTGHRLHIAGIRLFLDDLGARSETGAARDPLARYGDPLSLYEAEPAA